MLWEPTASFAVLRLRAEVMAQLRCFFAERNILEVETPLLYGSSATDLQLSSFTSHYLDRLLFLQTSPEFSMKRLLAAGSGPIYQISKAFRNGESGRLHNPEFTMLEWYRPDFNHHQLMDEIQALLVQVLSTKTPERLTYAQIFQDFLNINPHTVHLDELINCADQQGLVFDKNNMGSTKDGYFDLLMSHCIEPHLGKNHPVFVSDFPASQAGLAKVHKVDKYFVAERFEVYIEGMEIANAYHELTNPDEQCSRFERDNKAREKLGLPIIPIDNHLLAALEYGLPDSAGVALGVDRLVFLAAKNAGYQVESIDDVLTFPIQRV